MMFNDKVIKFEVGEKVYMSHGGRDGDWWDTSVVLAKELRKVGLFRKLKWFYLMRWGYENHWYPEIYVRKIPTKQEVERAIPEKILQKLTGSPFYVERHAEAILALEAHYQKKYLGLIEQAYPTWQEVKLTKAGYIAQRNSAIANMGDK